MDWARIFYFGLKDGIDGMAGLSGDSGGFGEGGGKRGKELQNGKLKLHLANIGVDGLFRNVEMNRGVLHKMKVSLVGKCCLQMQEIGISIKTSFETITKNVELEKMITIIRSFHLTEKIVYPHIVFILSLPKLQFIRVYYPKLF